ncbi:hypothetical protein HN011_012355, partial [Eciton burchellii]
MSTGWILMLCCAVWTIVKPGLIRKSRHANYLKDEDLTLNCPQCGRGYKVKPSLLKHLKYECGGRRNFRCDVCGRSFTQNTVRLAIDTRLRLKISVMCLHFFVKIVHKLLKIHSILTRLNRAYNIRTELRSDVHLKFIIRSFCLNPINNKPKYPVFLKPSISLATDLTTNASRFDTGNSLLCLSTAAVPRPMPGPVSGLMPASTTSMQTSSYTWKPQTDKPYTCPKCGKGLSYIFTLNRHCKDTCGNVRNAN